MNTDIVSFSTIKTVNNERVFNAFQTTLALFLKRDFILISSLVMLAFQASALNQYYINGQITENNLQGFKHAQQDSARNFLSELSLQKSIELAQSQDDWLIKSRFEQQRLLALSEGVNTWPDPTINVSILNLPSDSFAFDQEAMTQFKIGASQLFPRGNTLELQEERFKTNAEVEPFKRLARQREITLLTTSLWLDAYQNQKSLKLVQDAEPLFSKLIDIVSAGYSSSLGKTKQQDLIRAELELVRLNDRMVRLSADHDTALAKLAQFLSSGSQELGLNSVISSVSELKENELLPNEDEQAAILLSNRNDTRALFDLMMAHPLIQSIDQQIAGESVSIKIAEQAYKPQFGVNASYAYRDDSPVDAGHSSRADFFSIGVSISMPVFSKAKQDSQVSAAINKVEILKTNKRLLLRELTAGLKASIAQYHGATKRLKIHIEKILPQISKQADAALNAYTNDVGNFSEVVKAEIAQLDAKIEAISIQVMQQKALANIRFYLQSNSHTYNTNKHENSNGGVNNG